MLLSDLRQPLLLIAFHYMPWMSPSSVQMFKLLLERGFPVSYSMTIIEDPKIWARYSILDYLLSDHPSEYDIVDGEHESWQQTVLLFLKHGADLTTNIPQGPKNLKSGANKTKSLAYLKQASTQLCFRPKKLECIDKVQELVKEMLRGGADIESFDKVDSWDLQMSAYEILPDLYGITPEMKRLFHRVVEELDTSDPGWRIKAKEEGIRRAVNAAKEAARCDELYTLRLQRYRL